MNPIIRFWRSTIGQRVLMALTGIIGIGFVILHMVGNLQIFQGPEKLNGYSHMLHGPLNELLWVARVVLLVAVIVHIWMAYKVTVRNAAARPVEYQKREPQVSTWAARTMRWGGVLLLIFIPFHILNITTGDIHPGGTFVPGDVYGNLTANFRLWWMTAFYVLAMGALGLHLFHGAWSSWRTLGIAKPSDKPLHRDIAALVAVVVALGFALVPLSIFFGWVR
ncbi:MAG: succinate dehydrogenase cytochrome b subunit [Gemmatimonadales bacterium]